MSKSIFHCRKHGDWNATAYGGNCPKCVVERTAEDNPLFPMVVSLGDELRAAESRWEALREQVLKCATFIPQTGTDHTEAYNDVLDKMDELDGRVTP